MLAVLLVVSLLVGADGSQWRLLPTLGLFAYAGLRFIPMTTALTESLNRIRWNQLPLERLRRDFDRLEEHVEVETASRSPVEFNRHLELRDVSFSYPGGIAPALREISVRIPKGESIGIVGATGAGKSTLIHVILSLLDPSAGSVLVDGFDVRDNPAGWRRRVAYVPQAIHLIDDSLRRNIALGVADESIDDARVSSAVQTARLEAFVETLPDRLDTLVGDRGVRLSGGERQRVAIARAFYEEADVVLFDETTAAIDLRTEQELFAALRASAGGKTLIIVTHRVQSVRHCDRLILLAEGRIYRGRRFPVAAGEQRRVPRAYRESMMRAMFPPSTALTPSSPSKSSQYRRIWSMDWR